MGQRGRGSALGSFRSPVLEGGWVTFKIDTCFTGCYHQNQNVLVEGAKERKKPEIKSHVFTDVSKIINVFNLKLGRNRKAKVMLPELI